MSARRREDPADPECRDSRCMMPAEVVSEYCKSNHTCCQSWLSVHAAMGDSRAVSDGLCPAGQDRRDPCAAWAISLQHCGGGVLVAPIRREGSACCSADRATGQPSESRLAKACAGRIPRSFEAWLPYDCRYFAVRVAGRLHEGRRRVASGHRDMAIAAA